MFKKIKFLLLIVLSFSITAFGKSNKDLEEIPIPRSFPEACEYYLIKYKAKSNINGIVRVIHKQVCPKNEYDLGGNVLALTDIDCKKNKFMEVGDGDDLISNIKLHSSTEWSEIVDGSSRSDLVKFVCKSRKMK